MGTDNRKRNFLVQGSILAAASIISRLIGLLYRLPLTNIIGDAGIGDYNNAFQIYNIALILSSYSLPLSVSKLVAERVGKKEYKNSYKVFICAISFAFAIGLLASFIIYFSADLLADKIFNMPTSAIPLKVLAPNIFVFAVMGVLRGFFQGNHNMLPTSFSQILEQIVNAMVSIAAAYYLMKAHSASVNIEAYGAAGGTLGTLIGAITSLLFLGFVFWINKPIIKKKVRRDTISENESYHEVFVILILTIIPVILSQTVYQLSSLIDSSLFGHIMDGKGLILDERRALLGIYGGKYNLLVNVPVSIASAMAVAIVPSISSAYKNMAILDIMNKVQQSVKLNMIIAFPCAVGMGVLASPILQLLFNDERALPANLIRLGAIAIVFYSLSTVTNAVLQGINMLRLPVIHSAISLAIHIVIVYILLQFFNLSTYGLVIGNVTFALVVAILNWRAVAKHLNYKQEINKTFLVPAVCAVIMGIVTYISYQGIYRLITINSISTLAAIFLSAIIYFVLLLLLKGITEAELYGMPKGRTLVKIARKLHLL
ncbi:MAG: hypothetical protein K0R21_1059 [Anaerocolumna sp.]|jgi:stage V sporulation protein B|nr:hypothetical protein [Anaerocolumna sp.]